jgi:Na+-transporting methylmalonyl-CoA/oxaloacetate decarboxylase gamma subunit
MITILILAVIIYVISAAVINSKKDDESNKQNEKQTGHESSWFERNLWLIAVCVAIFLLRMCSELSK